MATLSETFTNIANAIRTKAGTTEKLTPAQMPTAIENIPSGGGELDDYLSGNIPEVVTHASKLAQGAFAYNGKVKTIYIPDATLCGNYFCNYADGPIWIHAPHMAMNGSNSFCFYASHLKYALFPESSSLFGTNGLLGAGALEVLDIGKTTYIGNSCGVYKQNPKLKALILRHPTTVCNLSNTRYIDIDLYQTYGARIYVPDDLVDSYKAATNWSTYADYILPLSDLPQWILDLYDDHYDYT